jgi:hypothetical protein
MALLTSSVMVGDWSSGVALNLAHPEFRTSGSIHRRFIRITMRILITKIS